MYVCDLVALYTFADFSLPLVSSFSGGATPQCALERCVVFDVRIERCLLLLLLELLLFVVVVVMFCYTVFVFLLNGKLFNEVAAAGIELAKKKSNNNNNAAQRSMFDVRKTSDFLLSRKLEFVLFSLLFFVCLISCLLVRWGCAATRATYAGGIKLKANLSIVQ